MSLDRFVDQYVKLLSAEVAECKEVLCTKRFSDMSEFSHVQGKLQGLQTALKLVASIPEEL